MPKSRTRLKAKTKRKVYTHQRSRKEGRAPAKSSKSLKQLNGCIQHSLEVTKLKIQIKHNLQAIAVFARNMDVTDHITEMYKQINEWSALKIESHMKASSTKMKLFLGENANNYNIPEDFHLGSTDLKNGYVSIENTNKDLFTIIMAKTSRQFPNDNITIGTIISHDEEVLEKLDVESLLKNEDVISTILTSRVSILEDKHDPDKDRWYCSSVSCTERKKKINFSDL